MQQNRDSDGTVHWPPPESLDDVDLLRLGSDPSWIMEDADGNRWEAHPRYPSFEMTTGPDGTTARHIYADRVVELQWNDEEGHWEEPPDA